MICFAAASSTAAFAQRNRNWDGYPNWGGSYELRQTALNAGYNEGSKAGREDHARGRRSDYSNSSAYRNATKDYNGRYGDRELYQRYFRLAFENGYDTEMGIQRNDRYDRDRDRDRDSNSNRDRDRNSDRGRDRWGRNWDRYGNYGGSFQLRQTALTARRIVVLTFVARALTKRPRRITAHVLVTANFIVGTTVKATRTVTPTAMTATVISNCRRS